MLEFVRYTNFVIIIIICRVTYLQFPIHSAFLQHIGRLATRQAAPALWRTIGFNTPYRMSEVAKKFG